MRKETDLAFQSLKKRLEILEAMTGAIKWISQVGDENEQLKQDLGDHDLTRIRLMESEREREDLKSRLEATSTRSEMWRESTLQLAEILMSLEKKGVKFTKAQEKKIASVLKEKYKNEQ